MAVSSSRWKAMIARNLWFSTAAFFVALLAIWLGHRRFLYSQECSWLPEDQDAVVLLTRDDFPLLFSAQKEHRDEQQQQHQKAARDEESIRVQPCHVFFQDYFQARNAFQMAVQDLKYLQQHQQQEQAGKKGVSDKNDDAMKKNQQHQTIQLYTLPVVPEMDYTIDIVVLPGCGNISSAGLVLHTSGVHGVEGYAGSAIQLAFLKSLVLSRLQERMKSRVLPPGTSSSSLSSSSSSAFPTIVLIHAVNPFGMARFRRANENNVDLNRNGVSRDDWDQHLEANAHSNHENYARFDTTLFNILDQGAPNGIVFLYKAIRAVLQHGIPRIKAAMVAGQYYQPRGIFYGGTPGTTIEPSIRILQEWLQNVLLPARSSLGQSDDDEAPILTWIDVHTGLGKFGHDTLLFKNNVESSSSSSEMSKQFAQWFPGSVFSQPTTSKKEKTPPSAVNGGDDEDDDDKNAKDVSQGYEQALGFLAEYLTETVFGPKSREKDINDDGDTGKGKSKTLVLVQEFGTLHNILVGHALMTENSAYDYYDRKLNQPNVALEWAKSTLGRVFYPQNRQWRRQVLMRGLRVLHQAIQRSSSNQVTTMV